ncbi:uncharacterized protein LOC124885787 [Capsicum annuum]|uniref:uncharacterized protein LOC124885787 n=1 Tax=Capsicum annuum TaxID=4072 RepID=UPI001FB18DBA|nr:uncharacterized protein LOC124885787 [Capsicum annuum]
MEDEMQQLTCAVARNEKIDPMSMQVNRGPSNHASTSHEENKEINNAVLAKRHGFTVDSGTTHHIAANKELLLSTSKIVRSSTDKVNLPNGAEVDISHTGEAIVFRNAAVKDVLFVSDSSSTCYLYTGMVKGIGRERGGLYIHKGESGTNGSSVEQTKLIAGLTIKDDSLWHQRLGHHSVQEHVFPFANKQEKNDPSDFLQLHKEYSNGTNSDTAENYTSVANYQYYVGNFSALVEPQYFSQAAADERWSQAMKLEVQALEDNNTWEIVDLPPGKNAIGSKWVYKIKYKANGDVERCIIALAASKGWCLYQMDMYNAFLQGDVDEEVYMKLPEGFQ